MELSREIYQLITQNVSSKTDLCSLARVSRQFRRASERALYNTLYMRDPNATIKLCSTLVSASRLAALVDALTVFAGIDENSASDSEEGEDEEGESWAEEISLPENYWESLAHALRCVVQLRFFNLHIGGVADKAWILRDTTFRLLSFHCDLAWDVDLVVFLNRQDRLHDLYLADYTISSRPPGLIASEEPLDGEAESVHQPQSDALLPASSSLMPDAEALPALSTLECSFIDAIATFANRRPLTRVKTCFSREDTAGKTGELERLCEGLLMTSTRVRSLDLADAAYTEEFSLSVLGALVPRLPELRYLGTLVLPVGLEVRYLTTLHAVPF